MNRWEKFKTNKNLKDNLYPNNKIKPDIDYFLAVLLMQANKVVNGETTQKIYNEYRNVLTGIECFKGNFSLQVRDDTKPYQVLPRHVAYTLHEVFIKELGRLQEHQILAPLETDERAKMCNSFVTVPKENDTVCLYLDPICLHQAQRTYNEWHTPQTKMCAI